MPVILSVAEALPAFSVEQDAVMEFAQELFSDTFKDIDRLLPLFLNGQIERRYFSRGLEWFKADHTFQEKNDAYIQTAVDLGTEAVKKSLSHSGFLLKNIPFDEIDAIITVTSSGISTPSLDARIMNRLPFSSHTKRIPLWGLGCAGGASGLSRAFEYCLAYPKSKVLLLSIELCSLTFQRNDFSKSNLVGTSLFADGAAAVVVCGDESGFGSYQKRPSIPSIVATESVLMENSLDVMGWDVKDGGFHVVFSRNIPSIVEQWLNPVVLRFLAKHNKEMKAIDHFIAHPGGKKVLDAYQSALNLPESKITQPLEVLKQFGNMSSATILYVLRRYMEVAERDDWGLAVALGPGFSSEMLLIRWR